MINKPPGLPFLTVFSVAGIFLLIWASYPSWYAVETFKFGISIGFVLFLYWTIRITWADYKAGAPVGSLHSALVPWYIAIVVVIVLVADAPFWVRYTISEPSLKAYAAAVDENPGRKEPCQWVGLYYVCDGRRYDDLSTGKEISGSARLVVRDLFGQDDRGFVWLTVGEPDETADGGDRYTHLGGYWCSYWYDSSW
ncbi:hypothetical protein [Nonomuraea fuscirosea]|uniref:hypothetical protein n=1 Tax=Nonomuraea fuscirosea TaxID=1291556 RepID=UPI00342E5DC5